MMIEGILIIVYGLIASVVFVGIGYLNGVYKERKRSGGLPGKITHSTPLS